MSASHDHPLGMQKRKKKMSAGYTQLREGSRIIVLKMIGVSEAYCSRNRFTFPVYLLLTCLALSLLPRLGLSLEAYEFIFFTCDQGGASIHGIPRSRWQGRGRAGPGTKTLIK